MFSRVPYRRSPAELRSEAAVTVHGSDVVVHLPAPLGPATIALDPQTVDVRHASRLRELSMPLFLGAFLFAACEAAALMLMSRTHRGVPALAFQGLWLPGIMFVVATAGHFDPWARRVRVRGASRSGHRVETEIAFATARSSRLFVDALQEAARRAPTRVNDVRA